MQIEIDKIPPSQTILIPVASEKLPKGFEFIGDIETIKHLGDIYQVFDYFIVEKGEPYQRALMKLALGKNINHDQLFKQLPDSDCVFLFVCDKISSTAAPKAEIKAETVATPAPVIQKEVIKEKTAPSLD
jgi:hypothetical protein